MIRTSFKILRRLELLKRNGRASKNFRWRAFNIKDRDCGGSQVVCVLAFYSDDLSSNPADVLQCNSLNCFKRMKINEKEARVVHLAR